MSSNCGKIKLIAQARDRSDNLFSTDTVEHGVHSKSMGTNPATADDGLIKQLRHIEELNLGPVLTEKQKTTKAKLAEVNDLLQDETTLLRKLQHVMREKEARVSKARSKAISMKEDHESNSQSDSFDIAWGLCQEELQDVEWEWQVLCDEQDIREA